MFENFVIVLIKAEITKEIHNFSCAIWNRTYSYSQYWTGTSLQLRLLWRIFSNANHTKLFFNDIPAHQPPLLASSRPILRMEIGFINKTTNCTGCAHSILFAFEKFT